MKTNRAFGDGCFLRTAIIIYAVAFTVAMSSVPESQAETLTPVSPESLPDSGSFYLASLADDSFPGGPPVPAFPYYGLEIPVYSIDSSTNNFWVDDLVWQMMENSEGPDPNEGEEVEGDGGGGGEFESFAFSTNDLWLEITAFTNKTAALVIHPPWNVTNGVYDLYFRTNLNLNPTSTFSSQWSRILRSAPGQTNLVVTNLPPTNGFFRLGPSTNAIRPGFDTNILDRNDDGYTYPPPSIGFAINFFGVTYLNLYVNNNGNVTLDHGLDQFKPYNPMSNVTEAVIIAPFWSDVDTGNSNSDVVKYGTNEVDGRRAFGANWVNVGYFSDHADKLLSCQLVIIDRSDISSNAFDLEFNYDKVEFDLGDVSEGYAARAGFNDGFYQSTNGYELPGSGVTNVFLDSSLTTALIYHSLNSSVSGRYVFYFRNGQPIP